MRENLALCVVNLQLKTKHTNGCTGSQPQGMNVCTGDSIREIYFLKDGQAMVGTGIGTRA